MVIHLLNTIIKRQGCKFVQISKNHLFFKFALGSNFYFYSINPRSELHLVPVSLIIAHLHRIRSECVEARNIWHSGGPILETSMRER